MGLAPQWKTGVASTGTNNVTSLAVTLPSGIQANDVVIVTLYKENTASVTPPSGFTEKTGTGVPPATNQVNTQHTFWKRMSGGESGSVTFSWTGNSYANAVADRFSDCITSGDPIGGISGNFNNTSSATSPVVSLTGTAVFTTLYWACGNFAGGSSETPPTGFTEREDTTDVLACATKVLNAGGNTGNVTGTVNTASTLTAVLLSLIAADTSVTFDHDAETVASSTITTATTQNTTHAGGANARAAVVVITQTGGAGDEISGVTYAGAAMTRLRFDTESTEAGAVYIYWLDNISTGSQTVAVTSTSTATKQVVVSTMSAPSGYAVSVAGHNTGTSASASNPSWTITGLTASTKLVAYEGIHSGLQTMTSTPAASWTLQSSFDEGATGRGFARQTVASSGTSLTCGWTASTADDFVGSAVAFSAASTAISGTGSVNLKKMALSGTGTVSGAPITGTGSVRLKKMILSGTGDAPVIGTGSVRLKKMSLSGTGDAPVIGTGSVRLKKMSLSGAGPRPFIVGTAGSGAAKYFVDGQGKPVMLKGDTVWGFPANAGAYGQTYQEDYDDYFTARSAQGYNAVLIAAISTAQNGGNNGGLTWDSVACFSSAGVLNSTYWDRIDYLVDSALANGITVLMDPLYSGDTSTGDAGTSQACAGWSSGNFTSYGTAIGNRYKDKPNIIWWFGGDYFDGQQSARMNPLLAAIQATGDTHLVSVENTAETTSRFNTDTNGNNTWGQTNADFNVVYSYNTGYWVVEYAYGESSPLVVVRGDGHYDSNSQAAFMRNLAWWAMSAGSRGFNNGDEAIWEWGASGALTAVSTHAFSSTVLPAIWDAIESLDGWHLLVPDTSSALITSGRGTRASGLASGGSGGAYSSGNTYVTGSITPDGSLAVIYMPAHGTITIDESQMFPVYVASWMDPADGSLTSTTVGSSYNSTGQGTNSAGGNDWVLVLQGIPGEGSVALKKMGVSGSGLVMGFVDGITTQDGNVTQSTHPSFVVPAGIQAGDIMLVGVNLFTWSGWTSPAITISSSPGSWTQLDTLETSGVDGGLQTYGAVFARVATGSDAGSTVTLQATGTPGTDQMWWAIAMGAWRGFIGGVDVVAADSGVNAADQNVPVPSGTTNADNEWVVYIGPISPDGGGDVPTGPSGSTLREHINSSGITCVIYDSGSNVGDSGTSIGGNNYIASNAHVWWTSFLVSLNPYQLSNTGTGSVSLKKMSLSGVGPSFDTGTGSVRLKKMSLSGTGTAPLLGTGSVALNKMSVSGADSGLLVTFDSTDGNGVDSYNVVSPMNGPGTTTLRVLNPTSPGAGYSHAFIYALPVLAGLDATFGDGLDVIRVADAHNTYNLTVIEPTFAIDPWYADNPVNPAQREDLFMVRLVQWVKDNLATTGIEEHHLIGFSKSGIGGQTLIFHHPDLFAKCMSWDFPADMSAYDTFGASSVNSYGTDANFQANYRLNQTNIDAQAAPFTAKNRIWISGESLYGGEVDNYDGRLTTASILHTYATPVNRTHAWDSGWVPGALADTITPFTSGTGSVRLKKMGVSGTGTPKVTGTGSVRLKKMSVSGTGTAPIIGTGSVRLKKPALFGGNTNAVSGTGSVRLKKMSVSGTGTAPLVGTGSVHLKKMSMSGIGKPKVNGTGSVRLKKMSLAGTARSPLIGAGSVHLKKMHVSVTATIAVKGTGSVALNKPSLHATNLSNLPASNLFIFTAV